MWRNTLRFSAHPVYACVLVGQSCPTLWDPMDPVDLQALLSVGFSRQEYWSG